MIDEFSEAVQLVPGSKYFEHDDESVGRGSQVDEAAACHFEGRKVTMSRVGTNSVQGRTYPDRQQPFAFALLKSNIGNAVPSRS